MNSRGRLDVEQAKSALPFAAAGTVGVICAALPPNEHPIYLVYAVALLGVSGLVAPASASSPSKTATTGFPATP